MQPDDMIDDLDDDTLGDLDDDIIYDLDLIEAGWRPH